MSNRRELLGGLAGFATESAASRLQAAEVFNLRLDQAETNLSTYVRLRGDLRDAPVFDLVRGRVFGLIPDQVPRQLFKMIGAQRSRYRRVSRLEYRVESQYVGILLDWGMERPLSKWTNPYNGRICKVPVTHYGPGSARLLTDRMLAADDESSPAPGSRPWFVIGSILHMSDHIFTPSALAKQPDADLMTFSGELRLLLDESLSRVPSRLSFTAVESWRDWMQMEQAGSLWWDVAGVKLDGPAGFPAELVELIRQHAPGFFAENST